MYSLEIIGKHDRLGHLPKTEFGLREYIHVSGIGDRRYQVKLLGENRFRVSSEHRRLIDMIRQRLQREFHIDHMDDGFGRRVVRIAG